MDPITHAALGAVTASLLARERTAVRAALLAGAAGGLLPDVDVLIRSSSDPLLAIGYHRHFTHSLFFAPLGGALVALLWWLGWRRERSFRALWCFATAGCASAGLLDACTSYGTRLLWPLSDERVAWNLIAIVDPVFTLGLLGGLVLILRGWLGMAGPRVVAGFVAAYLGLAGWQKLRVERCQAGMIAERGQSGQVVRSTVKPTLGNLVLWRSVYLCGGEYHIDAIRVTPWGECRRHEGGRLAAWEPGSLRSGEGVLARDVERFREFSDGYLVRHPGDERVIGDPRYAMLPDGLEPLWGIRVDEEKPESHVRYETFRRSDEETRRRFLDLLLNR